jgi:phage antirepressor YoqD-like protein
VAQRNHVVQPDGDLALRFLALDVCDSLHHIVRFLAQFVMVQQAELEAAQPKVEFHDEVSQSTGQFEIAEAARMILGGRIGNEKKLREWLLENGWVTRRSDGYRATAATESKGLLATRMGFQNGNSFSYAVVTPKGMVRLRHILRADDMLAHVQR